MDGSRARWKGVPAQLKRDPRLGIGALAVAFILVAVTTWSMLPTAGPGATANPEVAAGPGETIGASAGPSGSIPGQNPPAGSVGSANPSQAASPGPDEPWGSLALAPAAPVAVITTSSVGATIPTDSHFTLTSLGAADPIALARAVVVSPSVKLSIAAGPDERSAVLRPAERLEPGTIYRFALPTAEGALQDAWAFQTAAPLHVVATLPGDQATEVPATTGIEMTFDQDGAIDVEPYFSIEPAAKGRFEQHGRVVVFVPEQLAPATLYTVTLARGARLAGSDLPLEEDVVVRFETAATSAQASKPTVTYRFGRTMVETATDERPVLALSIDVWSDPWSEEATEAALKQPVAVRVYRLPSERAGIAAVRTISQVPEWTRWSTASVVATDELRRIGAFTLTPAPLAGGWGPCTIRLPVSLKAGWYVIEAQGTTRASQVVLQVTDVAGYALVATDRTLVWASDLATGDPLASARVEVVGGTTMGRTDADGLLVTATPAAILASAGGDESPADPQPLAIRSGDGRSLVVLGSGRQGWGQGYLDDYRSWEDPDAPGDRWWLSLATDRSVYRSTDTVNVWGFIRDRDTGLISNDVQLRLTGTSWSMHGRSDAPTIASVAAHPDEVGAFAASLGIADLPYGGYQLELWADGEQVAEQWISVSQIRKPAYQLELETDRHVLLAGDRVELTARATFFDGTPVPGVQLKTELFGAQTITTDRTGTAVTTAAASAGSAYNHEWSSASVRPVLGEEGDIEGYAPLLVFPAAIRIEAEGTIEDGQVVVTGSLHEVAIERIEAAWGTDAPESSWNGPAVPGATVTARITERVPVRTKGTSSYDFIHKRVVETWDYEIEEKDRGTRTLRTGSDGSLRLAFAANDDHDYEIVLSATDSAGRVTRTYAYASGPPIQTGYEVPSLRWSCGSDDGDYAVGDPVCLEGTDGSGRLPSGGANRFLFVRAQRGLRDVRVQPGPVYRSTFTEADVPSITVIGVWFTGSAVLPLGSFGFSFAESERELDVNLVADRARYAPGQTVTVDVRTADKDGTPVAASVVVRAVDEKLYAMGFASDQDPLWDLYEDVGSGVLWTYSSHPAPAPVGGGWGDTTGGGDGEARADFRDTVLFRRVTTGADGRGRVSFRVSDDLTSWHVSADAMTSDPKAGHAAILVPVGLPFFVEATLAPEYLAGDRPVLRLRAYGTGLREGDPVAFTVLSKSLGMPSTTIRGKAFEDAEVTLPELGPGEHALTIAGSSGSGAAALSDRLVRRFTVVGSRLTQTRTSYTELTPGLLPEGGPGFTSYVFTDAGRGRYLPALLELASSSGARVDEAVVAVMARDLLVSEFDADPERLPEVSFDPTVYQQGGVALLPYGSTDVRLTALAALLAAERFDREELVSFLAAVIDDRTSTRERQIQAYAGLAGLGQPVLAGLQTAASEPGLTIRERLWAALGLAVLGDNATATALEQGLLSSHGQRRGPWIRLDVGGSIDDTVEATSLLALLSAQLGDPLAPDAQAYLDANPAADELYGLQQVAFIEWILERTEPAAASFAYTIDGRRTVVELKPGETFSLQLLPAQRRGIVLEPLDGSVGLATSWQAALDPASLVRDPAIGLTRTYKPYPTVPGDAMVEVRLTASFGSKVVGGCHVVTDLVPSGLAPLPYVRGWWDSDSSEDEDDEDRFVSPDRIEGQRVFFCVGSANTRMRYFARIVTTGTYGWEPAVIQSATAPESINLTSASSLTIGP